MADGWIDQLEERWSSWASISQDCDLCMDWDLGYPRLKVFFFSILGSFGGLMTGKIGDLLLNSDCDLLGLISVSASRVFASTNGVTAMTHWVSLWCWSLQVSECLVVQPFKRCFGFQPLYQHFWREKILKSCSVLLWNPIALCPSCDATWTVSEAMQRECYWFGMCRLSQVHCQNVSQSC